MKKPTTISKESVSEYREFVQLRLRKRVLEAIEVVLEEEVDQALGCRSYERAEDRRGYRNGAETRRVTTSVGTRELRVPRARVRDEETGEHPKIVSGFTILATSSRACLPRRFPISARDRRLPSVRRKRPWS